MRARRPLKECGGGKELPVADHDNLPDHIKRLPRTKLGAVLLRVTEDYPIDETTGQDHRNREARRSELLSENRVQAAPFIEGPVPDTEEILQHKDHEDALRAGITWLVNEFENDLPVKLIIAAAAFEDLNYKSSSDLAEACGLTLRQVKSAKERMVYAVKKVGSPTFEAFLDHVAKKS